MVEFKFTAQRLNGQNISGSLSAISSSDGKKKISHLAEKNKLKIQSIQKKSIYLYRVRKGDDKPIRGEQKAFDKQEVEEALLEHEAVELAGVVGVHDVMHGEDVRAFITVKEGAQQPKVMELIKFARERVGYKAPEDIVILQEMPLNPTGKLDRLKLKRIAEEEHGHR